MSQAKRAGALLCAALALAAPRAAEARVSVVATFSVLADMAQEIGGPEADVSALVGPNGDTHVYQPTPGDAARLARADLLIENGLGLEGWIDRLRLAAGYKGPVVVAAGGVAALPGPDPHAWQDVANAEIYAEAITQGLEAADPAEAPLFRSRLVTYQGRLRALDGWIRGQVDSVPADQRRIITTHDAFGYFGRAYGIAFSAPVGMAEDSEPSAGAVAALIRQIRAEHTHAIFIENMTDPRLIERIAAETGVQPGGTLYADALSGPDGSGATYLQMMRSNVALMVTAMRPHR